MQIYFFKYYRRWTHYIFYQENKVVVYAVFRQWTCDDDVSDTIYIGGWIDHYMLCHRRVLLAVGVVERERFSFWKLFFELTSVGRGWMDKFKYTFFGLFVVVNGDSGGIVSNQNKNEL